MIEKYTLDNLNKDSVSVAKQQYINYDGQQYPIGDIWRRGYVNNTNGREQVITDLPQEQQNAIFSIWGDTPTVSDEVSI